MSAERHQQPWTPKFLSLKAADIYLFDQPPVSVALDNDNDCISRAPFHVKHAQLR